jgi:hypothetical protein
MSIRIFTLLNLRSFFISEAIFWISSVRVIVSHETRSPARRGILHDVVHQTLLFSEPFLRDLDMIWQVGSGSKIPEDIA